MVTNYPQAIATKRQVVEADQESVSMFERLRQMMCGLHGHDALVQFEQDRMFLRCVSCGHQTPGWELNEAPPTVTLRGDARHHRLPRPQLISARRIA